MKFRNAAILLLLVAAPVVSAHADSTENLAHQVNSITRKYYSAPDAQARKEFKQGLDEMAKTTDAYLRDIAVNGEKPAGFDQLVDAYHDLKTAQVAF